MQPNPQLLHQDLSEHDTPVNASLTSDYDCDDLYIDNKSFFMALRQHDFIDVITYTFNKGTGLKNIRRLIYSLPPRDIDDLNSTKVARKCDNIHTKLYIGYKSTRPTAAYIGSLNCLRATFQLNLMVKARRKHLPLLVAYFDDKWNQL